MGRWSQCARRCRVRALLPAPAAPELIEDGGFIWSQSSSASNIGGLVRLWQRGMVGEAPTLYREEPWEVLFEWGEGPDLPAMLLSATEVGNGVDWAGESAHSALYDNTGA